ncbi:hypothetical protein FBU59_004466 [Linderina macrospora]|uniref:Uncharacterized protein n=1 Tax=Linderina macrospora TaxID=4868 RepID=A0ACC1J5M0_9FUNG|nr:hypothetical protein FBU59_004466 [Linderina macrospora]
MDVKKIAHGLKEHIDYWSYTLHRPAGQYGKGWDKDAELLGGLNVGEDQRGLLHIRVVKGKALPKPSDTKSFQQRVEIRVGRKLETGDAQQADSVDPGFNLAGYFEQDLYTNTQAEISVFNKSKYWDSLVGRVLVPVRELHDVRTFNGKRGP